MTLLIVTHERRVSSVAKRVIAMRDGMLVETTDEALAAARRRSRMMPVGTSRAWSSANTLRSPRHFVLSAFGIVIGIATFVLFLASTEQVAAVLEKIFPVEQVQVVAPRASLLGKDVTKKLDDSIVKTIQQRPEVKQALPRMSARVPGVRPRRLRGQRPQVRGRRLRRRHRSGVRPGRRSAIRELFKDWDADANDTNRVACVPPPARAETR